MKHLNPYRFALSVQLLGGLTMMIAASRFTCSPGLSIGLYGLTWVPLLSYLGTFPLWRPWWLDQTEIPDTRPIWMTSAAFNTAATIAAWQGLGAAELITIQVLGMLTILAIIGRYRDETKIKNHE